MYPTLREGDRLLSLNFLPCLWLRKGQIVIGKIEHLESSSPELFADIDTISDLDFAFENLSESEIENLPIEPDYSKFIKRIIGLPGDTVCIPLSSLHEFMQTALRSRCDANGNLVWTVPENHCFVRGDGLISMDSLTVGPIPLSAITGIAVLKLPRHLDVNSLQQFEELCDEA
jgi:signal peptidase I